MPPQSHTFPLQQQQDVQQQQQQQEEQPQNETQRRINELSSALEESRKQMSVMESEMQKKFTDLLKESEQKQTDVELSSTVEDLRRQVSDMAKEMQKMAEVFVQSEQKKNETDTSETLKDLQRKMSDMEKKMQEQAGSHEKERVQWEEKWDSMASQIGLLRIYMTSGRNTASNINNQKQSVKFDSSSKKVSSSSKKVSSSSEKPKDDKYVLENQQPGKFIKAQLFQALCQHRLKSKEKKVEQPDTQTSDKVINEFLDKIYSTRSIHPKLLKKQSQKKNLETVQSNAENVTDGDSEKQSRKPTDVADVNMPNDNKSPIILRLKPATMDFSVSGGAISKYTLQTEKPTSKVVESSTNELKKTDKEQCKVTLELKKYKDGIEQNIAHVVDEQCRCKTDEEKYEVTMIKVSKIPTEDDQKDLEAKNEEESLAQELSEKLKLQGTTLLKCDNGDKESKGTNAITTEDEKDATTTDEEPATNQTVGSNDILIKMNSSKDQIAHVFSLALQEALSQMSRMQDQIQKQTAKYDTERKQWEDEKRTMEFQLKRLQARHQVLPPEVELKIESYKREHKTIFAWDVREKLIEEGYCDRANAPSVSAISKILRDL